MGALFFSHPIFKFLAIAIVLALSSKSSSSVAAAAAAAASPHRPGHYLVQIRNDLSHNTDLKVHCRTSHEDLGGRSIGTAQRFTVRFHNDKCVSVEYWCELSWESKSKSNVVNNHGGNYRLFNCEESFLKLCDFMECIWTAKVDGIYLHDVHQLQEVKFYDWEN